MMKRMKYARMLALPVFVGLAGPALAQVYQYPAQRPVQWFLDGGASITEGRTADDFNNGWTIGTGVNIRPDPTQPFMLRAEVNYSRSTATGQFIALNEAETGTPIDRGSLQTVTGFVDGVLEEPVGWARFYAMGGAGIGYRRIELTQNGFLCDPFFCSGFGHELVASSDSTHFAWNAGVGVDFPLPAGQSWFIEARYERIETSTPTEFVPIRIGLRF
jgi:opacity protein-like surface antigen